MALKLSKKERQERQLQEQIREDLASKHEARLERERVAMFGNRAEKDRLARELFQERQEQVEAQLNAEVAAEAERQERDRQADLARNQQLTAELRQAEQERSIIEQAKAQLIDPDPDLSSVAAAIRAAEREATVVALDRLWDRADAKLVQAERAVGRHRIGG